MRAQITIRDVPTAVRDELASRTALQGKSMQEYLRAELERLTARPPVEKVLERIRAAHLRYPLAHQLAVLLVRVIPDRGERARRLLGAGRKFSPERDAVSELVAERTAEG